MVQAQVVVAYNKTDSEGQTVTLYAEVIDGVVKVTSETLDYLMDLAGWEKR